MEYASIFAALGLSRQVERAVSCVAGSDAEKLIAGLLLAQTGDYEKHQFTDVTPWEFDTFPGSHGTLAMAGPSGGDAGVTWVLEYLLNGNWEPFDTQPADGYSDTRVQWPTERARLAPSAVPGTHIDAAKVG